MTTVFKNVLKGLGLLQDDINTSSDDKTNLSQREKRSSDEIDIEKQQSTSTPSEQQMHHTSSSDSENNKNAVAANIRSELLTTDQEYQKLSSSSTHTPKTQTTIQISTSAVENENERQKRLSEKIVEQAFLDEILIEIDSNHLNELCYQDVQHYLMNRITSVCNNMIPFVKMYEFDCLLVCDGENDSKIVADTTSLNHKNVKCAIELGTNQNTGAKTFWIQSVISDMDVLSADIIDCFITGMKFENDVEPFSLSLELSRIKYKTNVFSEAKTSSLYSDYQENNGVNNAVITGYTERIGFKPITFYPVNHHANVYKISASETTKLAGTIPIATHYHCKNQNLTLRLDYLESIDDFELLWHKQTVVPKQQRNEEKPQHTNNLLSSQTGFNRYHLMFDSDYRLKNKALWCIFVGKYDVYSFKMKFLTSIMHHSQNNTSDSMQQEYLMQRCVPTIVLLTSIIGHICQNTNLTFLQYTSSFWINRFNNIIQDSLPQFYIISHLDWLLIKHFIVANDLKIQNRELLLNFKPILSSTFPTVTRPSLPDQQASPPTTNIESSNDGLTKINLTPTSSEQQQTCRTKSVLSGGLISIKLITRVIYENSTIK